MWVRKFIDHGGSWVLLQAVILAGALLLPIWTGNSNTVLELIDWVEIVGLWLTVAGLLLFAASAWYLGRSLTPFPRPYRYTQLRTTGIYRWMRHPLYSGVMLASVGWAISWKSWIALGLCALATVFFDRKAAREERWLIERFPEYADYMQRVRKFIPGVY